MYIEDLVSILSLKFISNFWDANIITSFSRQIADGNYLTIKQRNRSVELIKKYKSLFDTKIQANVENYITTPVFKYPVRILNNIPYASIIDYNKWGPTIKLEFPYNQEQIDKIREYKEQFDFSLFDKDLRAWVFSLNENSLRILQNIFQDLTYDQQISEYLKDINKILEESEKHIPMLVLDDNIPKLINISPYTPPLQTTEILPAVFEARRKGISVWDDNIESYINSDNVNETVRKFIKKQNDDGFILNGEKIDISDIGLIIKNLSPCLIILPTGQELENLKLIYNFLMNENYSNNEISVMFRLDSEKNKNFNIFVKDNGINSPLTEKTKFVVVSNQIPKTLYKKHIRFNLILNFGYVNAHYTIRSIVKNCQNVIVLDYTNFFKQNFLKFNSENI